MSNTTETTEIADEETPMLNNAIMSDGSGSSARHGETPLSGIGYEYLNPFVSTVNAILPYRTSSYVQFDPDHGAATSRMAAIRFRLNSIYDVLTTRSYAANPTASADTADATVNTPMFRDYWMDKYEYWTVTSCDYTLKVRNPQNDETFSPEVYVYEHGFQIPPETNQAGTLIVPFQYRRMHPNLKMHKLLKRGAPTLAHNGYINPVQDAHWEHIYTGHYKPGSVKHEVVEDELAQVWHKPTEVPPCPETCTIYIQPSDYNAYIALATIYYELTINYHVQFKDLKVNFQYITQDSAVNAIPTFAAQHN
jgi:hypothetical protein